MSNTKQKNEKLMDGYEKNIKELKRCTDELEKTLLKPSKAIGGSQKARLAIARSRLMEMAGGLASTIKLITAN